MAQHPAPATFPEDVVPPQDERDMYVNIELQSAVDDEEWEDEEGLQISDRTWAARQTSARDDATRRTTPLKRRKAGSRKQTSLLPSPKPATYRLKILDHPALSGEAVVNETLKGAVFTSRYALDVFSAAIHLLRKPLSVLLFLWLLVFIIGQFSNTLRTVYAPLCIFPGISSSSLCHSPDTNASSGPNKRKAQWADYPKLMEVQSKSLNQLMDDSVGGSALSLEIKKAEMATTDLAALVRNSKLKSKDSLESSLTGFVHDAKKVGRRLQKWSSKVGGTVDSIMAMNDYALHSIESARASRSISDLMPWNPSRQSIIDEVITKTFEETMDALQNNIWRLVVEAEHNLQGLEALEVRLETLNEIITREEFSVTSDQSDLLADLWTIFGGNRKELRNFEHHLALLKELGVYRKQALGHVAAALQTLRTMSDDMQDMRERVAAPNLIGSSVPAEVHIKSIGMGLERLLEGRTKAGKLDENASRRVMSH